MMKRFVVALAVAVTALLAPGTASVQAQEVEVSGPLAGAPAVMGLRVYREMRFSLQAQISYTLQDEYARHILVGAQATFHPTDWLGIGGMFSYAVTSIDTGLTDEIVSKGQTNRVNVLSLPQAQTFADQIGRIQFVAAPQLTFIPLRGKMGIFEKLFVDTDFYIFGGLGIIGLEERADVDLGTASSCRVQGDPPTGSFTSELACFQGNTQGRTTRVALAPTFGMGLSFYMADFLAMTLEWRGLPFAWNTSGTDEAGDSRGDFPDGIIDDNDRLSHFNHMITLGFAFYLPTEPKLAHLDADGESTIEADEGKASGKLSLGGGSRD